MAQLPCGVLCLIYHDASKSISGDLESHHRNRAGFETLYAVAVNGFGCPRLRRPPYDPLSDLRWILPSLPNITHSRDARFPPARPLCDTGVSLRLLVRTQSAVAVRVSVDHEARMQHKDPGIDGRHGHVEGALQSSSRAATVAKVDGYVRRCNLRATTTSPPRAPPSRAEPGNGIALF